MSSLVNYISSWWVTPTTTLKTGADESRSTITTITTVPVKKTDDIVYLVSVSDLVSVKLRPVKDTIPAPARNMPPISKFHLSMLNQAQLKAILNVKLRPIVKTQKPVYFPPKHPVLVELLSVRPVVD